VFLVLAHDRRRILHVGVCTALWQRAYVERVIDTIRRECLDHVIVINDRSLYRHLRVARASGSIRVSYCPLDSGNHGREVKVRLSGPMP
jgi:hypothetical protein